jgi:hypothetical protein
MNKLLVWAMLLGIAPVTSVSADAFDAFAGLGNARATLTPELIAVRSERLEASTTFSLLRFPAAQKAPSRIFSPRIWNAIQSAARENSLDPMLLAGMIFIESYGDPLAKSPTGPAGIAQMTKSSAKEMGLSTSRRVQVGTRAVKKARYVGTGKNRRRIVETKLQPVYKTIDERYDPERAIRAMARRVRNRRTWLGGNVDFAVAEYHMGAGRMSKLLSAYFDRTINVGDVTATMRSTDLSYPELFWTNTPYHRPAVHKALEDLNDVDYSPTYYFRVRQAMRLLEVYRQSPDDYAQLAARYQNRLGYAVLPSWQWSFISDTRPHVDLAGRLSPLPDIAASFGVRLPEDASFFSAERSTIGCLLFVAQQLEALRGDKYRGFETTIVQALDGDDGQADPFHSFGLAFDVPRTRLSKDEVRDLKFVLTDLRHAGLLAFGDEGKPASFHIVRHPDHAERFEQVYWDTVSRPVVAPQQVERVDSVGEDEPDSRPAFMLGLSGLFSRMMSAFSGFFG